MANKSPSALHILHVFLWNIWSQSDSSYHIDITIVQNVYQIIYDQLILVVIMLDVVEMDQCEDLSDSDMSQIILAR